MTRDTHTRRFVRIDGDGNVVDTYHDDPDGFPFGMSNYADYLATDDEEN